MNAACVHDLVSTCEVVPVSPPREQKRGCRPQGSAPYARTQDRGTSDGRQREQGNRGRTAQRAGLSAAARHHRDGAIPIAIVFVRGSATQLRRTDRLSLPASCRIATSPRRRRAISPGGYRGAGLDLPHHHALLHGRPQPHVLLNSAMFAALASGVGQAPEPGASSPSARRRRLAGRRCITSRRHQGSQAPMSETSGTVSGAPRGRCCASCSGRRGRRPGASALAARTARAQRHH